MIAYQQCWVGLEWRRGGSGRGEELYHTHTSTPPYQSFRVPNALRGSEGDINLQQNGNGYSPCHGITVSVSTDPAMRVHLAGTTCCHSPSPQKFHTLPRAFSECL